MNGGSKKFKRNGERKLRRVSTKSFSRPSTSESHSSTLYESFGPSNMSDKNSRLLNSDTSATSEAYATSGASVNSEDEERQPLAHLHHEEELGNCGRKRPPCETKRLMDSRMKKKGCQKSEPSLLATSIPSDLKSLKAKARVFCRGCEEEKDSAKSQKLKKSGKKKRASPCSKRSSKRSRSRKAKKGSRKVRASKSQKPAVTKVSRSHRHPVPDPTARPAEVPLVYDVPVKALPGPKKPSETPSTHEVPVEAQPTSETPTEAPPTKKIPPEVPSASTTGTSEDDGTASLPFQKPFPISDCSVFSRSKNRSNIQVVYATHVKPRKHKKNKTSKSKQSAPKSGKYNTAKKEPKAKPALIVEDGSMFQDSYVIPKESQKKRSKKPKKDRKDKKSSSKASEDCKVKKKKEKTSKKENKPKDEPAKPERSPVDDEKEMKKPENKVGSTSDTTSHGIFQQFYRGVSRPEKMDKQLNETEFLIYYAFRQDDGFPIDLPLYVAYKDTNQKVHHFEIKTRKDSHDGVQWYVVLPNNYPCPSFSNLSRLIIYYTIYSYIDPATGVVEVFPVWDETEANSEYK